MFTRGVPPPVALSLPLPYQAFFRAFLLLMPFMDRVVLQVGEIAISPSSSRFGARTVTEALTLIPSSFV